VCAIGSTAGIALAAYAEGLVQLAMGYGVLFGIGGGIAYILVQQAVNMMLRGNKGLVNGYIVALYPAGAMIAAPLFGWALGQWGLRATMGGLAGTLALTGALATLLIAVSGARLAPASAGIRPATVNRTAIFVRMWLVFFLAAAAGLTVLSQAAGIVAAYGGATTTALAATTAITAAIAGARLGGGWLVDKFTVPSVMAGAHMLALAGTVLLSLWPDPIVAAITLAMIGMGYGFISGSTAGGIALYWPSGDYGRIASRLYIAWCVAAVSLPVLAGHLFDLTGGYATAIIIAGCGNLLGIVVALQLPARAPH